jgi:cell division protein FtsB
MRNIKILKLVVLGILITLIAGALYNLKKNKSMFENQAATLKADLDALTEENREVEGKIKYFDKEENRIKELKTQFNYKEEGEHVIMIVPESSATPATATGTTN